MLEERKLLEKKLHYCEKNASKENCIEIALEELTKIKEELNSESIIYVPQLIASDITQEALADLLYRNGGRAGIFDSESDFIDIILGRYKSSIQIGGTLLKGFDGDEVFINRKSSEDVCLDAAYVTIALAVQPEAVYEFLSSSKTRGRGLLARFIILEPEIEFGNRKSTPPNIPPELQKWWGEMLFDLLNLERPSDLILTSASAKKRGGSPAKIKLSDKAQNQLLSTYQQIELKTADSAEYSKIRDFAGKLPGRLVRIALALHFLSGETFQKEIDEKTMYAACQFEYFLTTQYGLAIQRTDQTRTLKIVKRILKWFARRNFKIVSQREIYQFLKDDHIRKMEDVYPAIKMMLERNYLHSIPSKKKGPGRTSEKFRIDGREIKEFAEKMEKRKQAPEIPDDFFEPDPNTGSDLFSKNEYSEEFIQKALVEYFGERELRCGQK